MRLCFLYNAGVSDEDVASTIVDELEPKEKFNKNDAEMEMKALDKHNSLYPANDGGKYICSLFITFCVFGVTLT